VNWVIMVSQAIVYASALLILRFSLPLVTKEGYSLSTVLWITLGGIMTVASFALWIYILRTNSVSVAYPITVGISLIFVSVGAWMFLREEISSIQIFGMFLLFVGVVLVSWNYKAP
jgi:drug/metabolite transporter (DMT)-like permease